MLTLAAITTDMWWKQIIIMAWWLMKRRTNIYILSTTTTNVNPCDWSRELASLSTNMCAGKTLIMWYKRFYLSHTAGYRFGSLDGPPYSTGRLPSSYLSPQISPSFRRNTSSFTSTCVIPPPPLPSIKRWVYNYLIILMCIYSCSIIISWWSVKIGPYNYCYVTEANHPNDLVVNKMMQKELIDMYWIPLQPM